MARRLTQTFKENLSSRTILAKDAEGKVSAILNGVRAEMNRVSYNNVSDTYSSIDIKELSTNEQLSAWRSAAFVGGFGVNLAIGLGLIAVPVVGAIVGGAIAIGAWLFGKKQSDDNLLEKNKNEFKKKLVELLNELSAKLLHVQGHCNRSIVSNYAIELKESADKAIQNILYNSEYDNFDDIDY